MRGRLLRHAFEYAVEVGDAIEPAIIGYGGDAVVVPIRQLLTCFVDTYFVEEGDEGVHGMFFKIPAEGLWGHMSLFGGIFQGNGLVVLLHDEVVNGSDANAFMFAIGGRLGTGRQGLQLMEAAERLQQFNEMDELIDARAILYRQHFI